MEFRCDTERLANLGKRTVCADHQARGYLDWLTVTGRLQTDHTAAVETKSGKDGIVPEAAGILFFQRIENGMVRHIG